MRLQTTSLAALAGAAFLLAGCATVAPVVVAAPAPAPEPSNAPFVVPPAPAPAAFPTPPPNAPNAPNAPTAAAAAARPASGAQAATPPAAPGAPPPFATVIKDAKQSEGLFAVWQKEEKVWLELKPEDFGKPFFLSPKLSRGIGEAGLYGGSMFGRWASFGRPQIVEFKRVNNQVRLVARNNEFVANAGTPESRAVAAGFSTSLLGSAVVASLPHPERKTVLIEANALFLTDMQGLGMSLQRTYRQGYSFDPRHSSIDAVRTKPDMVVFEVTNHFYAANIAIPQPGPPGMPPSGPAPTTPDSLPDVRSLFLGLHYSIAKLPDVPMAPRRADPRVGYFSTTVQDFSNDLARTPKQRYVNRWRLEKKDPTAALSEPVKPIVYWLDRTVPVQYRAAITEGVLEWNKAFERIGFKDAVVVKVQPDDASFDTLDVGVASIRWMTNSQPSFGAIGPSHIDPRTGEILDADIGFESLSSRGLRYTRAQVLTGRGAIDWAGLMQARDAVAEGSLPMSGVAATGMAPGHAHTEACQHGDMAAEQLGYALDVFEARGDIEPDSAEAQQFVLDYLKDTAMHEVGHTLGLRHNFRSSRIYSDKQLSDPTFTRANGLAGSVMEYAPINLPRPGQAGGTPWQLTLGPYDYWAIEYAYKPIAPAQEGAELQRMAARSAEPALAYGTDEDNMLGIDPESLHFDLGNDVVAFAKKRIEIGRDLVARQELRPLKPTADYAVLRRSLGYAVRDVARAAGVLARQIGGVRTLRDYPGSGRDPLVPVAATVQRDALDTLAKGVLAADSFKISPALQRKLAPDYNDRWEAFAGSDAPVLTDFSVNAIVLDMQRALLAQLMSDGVASRILDSAGKADKPQDSFRLTELYGRLTKEVWSELSTRGDIPGLRRELQREHVNRLSNMLLRPTGSSRADTRSLLRSEANGLLARMSTAAKRPGLSGEARAHLQDSAETLGQALAAKLPRVGV